MASSSSLSAAVHIGSKQDGLPKQQGAPNGIASAAQGRNGVKKDELEDEEPEEADRDASYFQYYALLSHQAQMLQDSVRTSTYQKAISAHADQCFRDKLVIDVGAGNGILSIFSVQAGARKVFAVEASNMVERLQHFVRSSEASVNAKGEGMNPWLSGRLLPVHSKMEDVTSATLNGVEQVDTIVSECLGVLLVHERMCESFIDARDRFLKPGGTMLPSSGTICLTLIEDKVVWEEAANKARFWNNRNFYGVDITPFAEAAWDEVFSSPVVGCFGPLIVLTTSNDYQIDFQTISKEDLKYFTIPLSFEMTQTSVVHGLGGWFDLSFLSASTGSNSQASALDMEMASAQSLHSDDTIPDSAAGGNADPAAAYKMPDFTGMPDFNSLEAGKELPFGDAISMDPTISSTYMSTSPFSASTHWQQVRFLLQEPLAVNKGQRIVGQMECRVNQFRSYTLTATLHIEGSNDVHTKRTAQWRLDRQIYSWTSASPATQ